MGGGGSDYSPVAVPTEEPQAGVSAPKQSRERRLRSMLSKDEEGFLPDAPIYRGSLLARD